MKCWKCVMFQSEFHVKQIIYFLPLNLKSQWISSSNIYISIARSMFKYTTRLVWFTIRQPAVKWHLYMKVNKFVRIFRLSFVIVPNFFFENPNEQSKKKRITHSHRSNPELWSWVHTKKHFQFFRIVLFTFSRFFSKSSRCFFYFHLGSISNKNKTIVPIVSYDRECIKKL
jgi:hypothetical protein